MSDVLMAAVVGSLSGLLASVLTLYFAYINLKTDYKGKLQLEIISKQISACESLWVTLSTASRSDGDERILNYQEDQILLNIKNAKKLYDCINDVFNSRNGLYFSKNIRKYIFDLRNFIKEDFLQNNDENHSISKTKAAIFDGHVQNLRQAIRQEINVVDLVVTKEGPLK